MTPKLAWLVLSCLCCSAGCRVGRSVAASPFSADAGAVDDSDEPRDEAGSGGASGVGASGHGGTGVDAPLEDGGAGGVGGSGGFAGDPAEPDASVVGDSCDPAVVACNPVTNEGCPPPMQCAVDLLSDVLAGYCIFNGPVADGCFNSGVTESCPPTETCFNFECRTLCFCDGDCKEGQCCVDPIGELGFKACGDC